MGKNSILVVEDMELYKELQTINEVGGKIK